MKTRYWVIISSAVALIFLALVISFMWSMSYVPFIGKELARSRVAKYSGEAIEFAEYNLINEMYVVKTKTHNGNDYEHEAYRYHLISDTIYDPAYNTSSNTKIQQLYTDFKEENSYENIYLAATTATCETIISGRDSKKHQTVTIRGIFDSSYREEIGSERNHELVEDFLEYLGDEFNVTKVICLCGSYSITYEARGQNLREIDNLTSYAVINSD